MEVRARERHAVARGEPVDPRLQLAERQVDDRVLHPVVGDDVLGRDLARLVEGHDVVAADSKPCSLLRYQATYGTGPSAPSASPAAVVTVSA